MALSAVLVVAYVLCVAAALVAPTAPLAHGWVSLFSVAEMGTLRNLVEGVVASIVFSWVASAIFTPIYNRLAD
jgi:hypothetical protein